MGGGVITHDRTFGKQLERQLAVWAVFEQLHANSGGHMRPFATQA